MVFVTAQKLSGINSNVDIKAKLTPSVGQVESDAVTALRANASFGHSIPIYKHFKTDFMALKRLFHADAGGHGGLRYCGIELFFKRYFGNFDFNVRYCGIIQPCGMRFFILLANGIR